MFYWTIIGPKLILELITGVVPKVAHPKLAKSWPLSILYYCSFQKGMKSTLQGLEEATLNGRFTLVDYFDQLDFVDKGVVVCILTFIAYFATFKVQLEHSF